VLGIAGSKGTVAGAVTVEVWETPGRVFAPE
jgi:hypothetical protein